MNLQTATASKSKIYYY
uniref:Uncharacterized protein n=1 Tax=Arundo donax TaxID=35708 RepID=A0A0A9FEG9_ARUDO